MQCNLHYFLNVIYMYHHLHRERTQNWLFCSGASWQLMGKFCHQIINLLCKSHKNTNTILYFTLHARKVTNEEPKSLKTAFLQNAVLYFLGLLLPMENTVLGLGSYMTEYIWHHFSHGKWKVQGAIPVLEEAPETLWCMVKAVWACWNTLNFEDFPKLSHIILVGTEA